MAQTPDEKTYVECLFIEQLKGMWILSGSGGTGCILCTFVENGKWGHYAAFDPC